MEEEDRKENVGGRQRRKIEESVEDSDGGDVKGSSTRWEEKEVVGRKESKEEIGGEKGERKEGGGKEKKWEKRGVRAKRELGGRGT